MNVSVSEILSEIDSNESDICLGLANQKVSLPCNRGYTVKTRIVHYIRRDINDQTTWLGAVFRHNEWLLVKKRVTDTVWLIVKFDSDKHKPTRASECWGSERDFSTNRNQELS